MELHENARIQNQHKLDQHIAHLQDTVKRQKAEIETQNQHIANLQDTVKIQKAEIETQKRNFIDLSQRMDQISQMYKNEIAQLQKRIQDLELQKSIQDLELQKRIQDLENKKHESSKDDWDSDVEQERGTSSSYAVT